MTSVFAVFLILASFVFAGLAIAPVFNRFLPKDKAPTKRGACLFILPAMFLFIVGWAILFTRPDPTQPQYDRAPPETTMACPADAVSCSAFD